MLPTWSPNTSLPPYRWIKVGRRWIDAKKVFRGKLAEESRLVALVLVKDNGLEWILAQWPGKEGEEPTGRSLSRLEAYNWFEKQGFDLPEELHEVRDGRPLPDASTRPLATLVVALKGWLERKAALRQSRANGREDRSAERDLLVEAEQLRDEMGRRLNDMQFEWKRKKFVDRDKPISRKQRNLETFLCRLLEVPWEHDPESDLTALAKKLESLVLPKKRVQREREPQPVVIPLDRDEFRVLGKVLGTNPNQKKMILELLKAGPDGLLPKDLARATGVSSPRDEFRRLRRHPLWERAIKPPLQRGGRYRILHE